MKNLIVLTQFALSAVVAYGALFGQLETGLDRATLLIIALVMALTVGIMSTITHEKDEKEN